MRFKPGVEQVGDGLNLTVHLAARATLLQVAQQGLVCERGVALRVAVGQRQQAASGEPLQALPLGPQEVCGKLHAPLVLVRTFRQALAQQPTRENISRHGLHLLKTALCLPACAAM